MSASDAINKTLGKPIILSTVSHEGISTLDLSTVPHHILVNITAMALAVVAEHGHDNISAITTDAEDILGGLAIASRALDSLYLPTVPSREEITNMGLTVEEDDQGYPVIRDGRLTLVKADKLTLAEVVATRQHMEFNIRAANEKSESFQARLEQFNREAA